MVLEEVVLLPVLLQMLAELLPLLLQVLRQRLVHVIEHRQHRRQLVLLAAVQGVSNGPTSGRSLALLVGDITALDVSEELGKTFDGVILLLPLPAFVLGPVESRVV